MGAGIFFLILLLIAAAVVVLAVAVPAVVGYFESRDDRLRQRLAEATKQKRIAYKALREIMASNGDGAGLIAEIAVNEIDNNELKELN